MSPGPHRALLVPNSADSFVFALCAHLCKQAWGCFCAFGEAHFQLLADNKSLFAILVLDHSQVSVLHQIPFPMRREVDPGHNGCRPGLTKFTTDPTNNGKENKTLHQLPNTPKIDTTPPKVATRSSIRGIAQTAVPTRAGLKTLRNAAPAGWLSAISRAYNLGAVIPECKLSLSLSDFLSLSLSFSLSEPGT